MSLFSAQEKAWEVLKRAVDNYSKATSTDIAVVTPSFVSLPSSNQNYRPVNLSNQKIIIYGHGNLVNQIKDGLDKNVDEVILLSKEEKSMDNAYARVGNPIPISRRNYEEQTLAKSLSTSFRTLKLDIHPSINTGTSGATVTTNLRSDPMSSEVNNTKGKKISRKSKKSFSIDQELELDDNLMFNESNDEGSEDESSEESEDDSFSGNFPQMYTSTSHNHDPMSHAQFATSLPVNINLNWGTPTESSKLRTNNPHGGKTPYVTIAKKYNKTDQIPQLNTMMASMQALAKSVTNDSAMIFGDRPRPRLEASKLDFNNEE